MSTNSYIVKQPEKGVGLLDGTDYLIGLIALSYSNHGRPKQGIDKFNFFASYQPLLTVHFGGETTASKVCHSMHLLVLIIVRSHYLISNR